MRLLGALNRLQWVRYYLHNCAHCQDTTRIMPSDIPLLIRRLYLPTVKFTCRSQHIEMTPSSRDECKNPLKIDKTLTLLTQETLQSAVFQYISCYITAVFV